MARATGALAFGGGAGRVMNDILAPHEHPIPAVHLGHANWFDGLTLTYYPDGTTVLAGPHQSRIAATIWLGACSLLVPKGRDAAGQKPHPQAWVRRHDEYNG